MACCITENQEVAQKNALKYILSIYLATLECDDSPPMRKTTIKTVWREAINAKIKIRELSAMNFIQKRSFSMIFLRLTDAESCFVLNIVEN